MVGQCKDCAHWDTQDSWASAKRGLGVCAAAKMFFDCTEWDKEGERRLKPGHELSTAFVQDGSDYRAYLLTKEDHGCTMWRGKL